MNLIYIVFGQNFNNHLETNFSIISFLARKNSVDKIYVMTDDDQYYQQAVSQGVEIILVTPEQLKSWQEPYGFFWRIKIKAIQYVVEKYPDQNWLYLDADTFLSKELYEVRTKLENGESVMHLNEGKLSELNSKTERLMWQQSKGKKFAGYEITDDLSMWNAGAIGIPSKNATALMIGILLLCDEMCEAGITRRLIEQFAFSVVLNSETKLSACDNVIVHYWANKEEWNEVILDFFTKTHFKDLSQVELYESFRKIDFNKVAVYKKGSSTRLKLGRIINKLFPDKDISHLK